MPIPVAEWHLTAVGTGTVSVEQPAEKKARHYVTSISASLKVTGVALMRLYAGKEVIGNYFVHSQLPIPFSEPLEMPVDTSVKLEAGDALNRIETAVVLRGYTQEETNNV